jgi:hypothetical protein
MTIALVPHAEEWREPVRALNERMRAKGGFGFFEDPVPAWLPAAPGRETYRELFVATDGREARGGYVLKHEPSTIAGRMGSVASVQGPYSEGAVDPRHARVVFAMVRDMTARQPLLYGWGLERRRDTVLRLFGALGWRSHATPLLLWLGAPPLAGRWKRGGARAEVVDAFGAWADEVWERAAPAYAFAVRRDRRTLDDLYPASNPRFVRLAVRRGGDVIGWALVGARKFHGHPRFRSARVGVLWDFLAAPEDAPAVIGAAHRHLGKLGACAVLGSACHADWIAAFRAHGFRERRRERRHFLVSKEFAAALAPFDQRAAACHLTFGDGESYTGTLGRTMFGEG